MQLNLFSVLMAGGGSGNTLLLIIMAVMIGAMFFMQNRDSKKQKQMRENLEVGDEILTRGGILGRLVSVKDDTFLLETGSDHVKIRFSTAAIEMNLSAQERMQKKKSDQKKKD